MVTTNSGYPLDQNLYQAVKGMSAAAQVVAEGGFIAAASRCNDGFPAHGNFKKLLFDHDSPRAMLDTILTPGFSLYDQWEAQLLGNICLKARVGLFSELPPDEVKRAHLEPLPDLAERRGARAAADRPRRAGRGAARRPDDDPLPRVSDSELHLWLVRHGETPASRDGFLAGWTNVPLTETGQAQAKALRPLLAAQTFTSVWSSDLDRTMTTARLAYGETPTDRRLRELHFGELEGQPWREIDARHQAALLAFEGFAAPGGESLVDLRARVLAFVGDLASRPPPALHARGRDRAPGPRGRAEGADPHGYAARDRLDEPPAARGPRSLTGQGAAIL